MKGIIYLIESNGLKYVGSTDRTIKQRLAKHKCFNLYNMNKYDYSVSILEEVKFNEKIELRQREQYYIDTINCCNEKRAIGLPKKEYDKKLYLKNRTERIEKASQYQKTDKAKLQRKKRYENNKDKFKQYTKDNKERINEKRKELRERKITWGGDPRNSNNLLMIDINIFI